MGRKRNKKWRAVKRSKRQRQDGKPCTYCARAMDMKIAPLYPTLDHVEPGGRITVWSCYTCNHVKRDMTPDEWAIYRDEHPEWWLKGRRALNALNWSVPGVTVESFPPETSKMVAG